MRIRRIDVCRSRVKNRMNEILPWSQIRVLKRPKCIILLLFPPNREISGIVYAILDKNTLSNKEMTPYIKNATEYPDLSELSDRYFGTAARKAKFLGASPEFFRSNRKVGMSGFSFIVPLSLLFHFHVFVHICIFGHVRQFLPIDFIVKNPSKTQCHLPPFIVSCPFQPNVYRELTRDDRSKEHAVVVATDTQRL